MFDSDQAYAQVTQPDNMRFFASDTTPGLFYQSLKIIMVADADLVGIAASILQAGDLTTWIPTDHASHSLTPYGKRPCTQNL